MLIHQFLEASTREFPDKCALIQGKTRLSYEIIFRNACAFSRFLQKRGIRNGDRIVISHENSVEYVVAYYGILIAGGVVVSLSTQLKPDGLAPLLDELEPSAAMIAPSQVAAFCGCAEQLERIGTLVISNPPAALHQTPGRWHDFNAVVDETGETGAGAPLDENNLAAIVYTSGSTGKPKGVMLTHGNIAANTRSIVESLRLTQDDIQMVVLPFFYVMGTSLLNTHVSVGGTVVINNQFAYPAAVLKQMADERVTGFSGVPSTYAFLLNRSPLAEYKDKLPSLRYCSQAGGHMSSSIKRELCKTLPAHTDLYIMYGATEASARLTCLEPSRLFDKIESIGKEIPQVRITIRDGQGKELPPGKEGVLVASGPNIMQGYWKDSEGTSRVLSGLGYHTGDLGYRDDDGFLYVTGRKDSLLKIGGHRINPQEIEDAVLATGMAIEAVVLGVPDPLLGYKLYALATPKSASCSEDELLAALAASLPRYKLPGRICFTPVIPKNANGKTDRSRCIDFFNN